MWEKDTIVIIVIFSFQLKFKALINDCFYKWLCDKCSCICYWKVNWESLKAYLLSFNFYVSSFTNSSSYVNNKNIIIIQKTIIFTIHETSTKKENYFRYIILEKILYHSHDSMSSFKNCKITLMTSTAQAIVHLVWRAMHSVSNYP